jgi:hypothetical protein
MLSSCDESNGQEPLARGDILMWTAVLFVETSPDIRDRQSSKCMLWSVDRPVLGFTQQTYRPVPCLIPKDVAACEPMLSKRDGKWLCVNRWWSRVSLVMKLLCSRFS